MLIVCTLTATKYNYCVLQVRACVARWRKVSRAREKSERCPCRRHRTWNYMAGSGRRRARSTRPPRRTAHRVPGAPVLLARTVTWTRWRLPCNTIRPSFHRKSNNSFGPPAACTCHGITPPLCRPPPTTPHTTYTCCRYLRRTFHRSVLYLCGINSVSSGPVPVAGRPGSYVNGIRDNLF